MPGQTVREASSSLPAHTADAVKAVETTVHSAKDTWHIEALGDKNPTILQL